MQIHKNYMVIYPICKYMGKAYQKKGYVLHLVNSKAKSPRSSNIQTQVSILLEINSLNTTEKLHLLS